MEAAIFKLQKERSTESPPRDDALSQLRSKTGRDVSQLVRRFSSDRSASEKEDRSSQERSTPDRRTPDRGTPDRLTPDRRTPDRSQSFRDRTPDRKAQDFVRANSFREKRSSSRDSSVADDQLREILRRRSQNIDQLTVKVIIAQFCLLYLFTDAKCFCRMSK